MTDVMLYVEVKSDVTVDEWIGIYYMANKLSDWNLAENCENIFKHLPFQRTNI